MAKPRSAGAMGAEFPYLLGTMCSSRSLLTVRCRRAPTRSTRSLAWSQPQSRDCIWYHLLPVTGGDNDLPGVRLFRFYRQPIPANSRFEWPISRPLATSALQMIGKTDSIGLTTKFRLDAGAL